jgi:ribonuclease HI
MILYCDGASRGNPGPASFGFVVCEGSHIVAKEGGTLGTTTNNVAEYEGLIRGLKKSVELGATELTVKADSELMIRQLNGIYKVKTPHIKVLFDRAQTEIKKLKKVQFIHIRREENSVADQLCNEALDLGY